ILDGVPAGELLPDVLNHRWIDVKFSDVVADVFLPGIAEHFELSAIGAEDGAVRPDPMETDHGVLEKVVKQLFVALEGNLGFAALGNIVEDHDDAGDLAGRVPDGRGAVFDREFAGRAAVE